MADENGEQSGNVRVLEDGRTVFLARPFDAYMKEEREEIRKLALSDPDKKIVLVISSPGGACYGCFALMDEIALLKAQTGVTFEGVVQGWAMSAGSVLLQACDRRVAGPYSQLMVHGAAGMMLGDEEDFEVDIKHLRRLNDRLASIYGSRTAPLAGKTTAQWRALLRRGLYRYYDAQDALREGLVDEVIG